MRRWTRFALWLFALALLTAAYQRIESPSIMTDAGKAYLASLPPDLRAQTMMPFSSGERTNWHFVPLAPQLMRKGVANGVISMAISATIYSQHYQARH